MATYTSAYDQLMRNSITLLVDLRRQIAARETELKQLRHEEHRLDSLVRPGAADHARQRTPRGRRRTDWQAVLAKLPKQFQASDIRKIPQAASKRSSEMFAAITRWIEAGLTKRKERGVYQKTNRWMSEVPSLRHG